MMATWWVIFLSDKPTAFCSQSYRVIHFISQCIPTCEKIHNPPQMKIVCQNFSKLLIFAKYFYSNQIQRVNAMCINLNIETKTRTEASWQTKHPLNGCYFTIFPMKIGWKIRCFFFSCFLFSIPQFNLIHIFVSAFLNTQELYVHSFHMQSLSIHTFKFIYSMISLQKWRTATKTI